jgi:PAT family beta-lactamase induction signal transducer AmpG
MQAILSSTYIAGYRIAMIVAGAGALFIAEYLGSEQGRYDYSAWRQTYLIMAAVMLVGIATTLTIKEPKRSISVTHSITENLQLVLLFALCVGVFIGSYLATADLVLQLRNTLSDMFSNKPLASTLVEALRLGIGVLLAWLMAKFLLRLHIVQRKVVATAYIEPVGDFFKRYGARSAWLLLALIGLYRISDIVLGVISNVFYYDLEFTKGEIATVSKVFGLLMTIIGGFLGGLLAFRYGVMRILLLGAVLSAATNLLFMVLAQAGHSLPMLYLVISADNLSAGLAGTAFVAFLSALTNIRFTAMQYAIFSSLMTLLPKILGGYSGSMVDGIGYSNFFLVTALIGVPVIILILLCSRWLDLDEPSIKNGNDQSSSA